MPAFPAHVVASPVPAIDDTTLLETGCRLVGAQDHERTGCARGLTFPSIYVDLSAIDQALEQHVPVIDVSEDVGAGAGGQPSDQFRTASSTAVQALKAIARFLLARLGMSSFLLPQPGSQPPNLVAWHCNKQTVAVGHASSGAVLLYDCADSAGAAVLDKAHQVLTHQQQQQVSSVAWRPVNSSMLAVGCEGGVALWSLGKLPLAAPNRSAGGAPPATGWVTFLPYKKGCRVSNLAWSPDGRLLAGSSSDSNRMVVWDVALGVGATLRLGLQPVACLAWSPDGSYLFAAAQSGRFFLYETTAWALRSWDTPLGSTVTAAAWAPDSSAVLLAMSGSSYLIALHLIGEPPKLVEQLLPIMLPGISDVQPESKQSGAAAAACVHSMAWDPTGSRLAVVLGKPHPAAGTVALYSTSYRPVVECSLIGYVQPGVARDATALGRQPANCDDDSSNAQSAGAADAQSRYLSLAFAPVAGKAGGVLSIGVGSTVASGSLQLVRNVVMYF